MALLLRFNLTPERASLGSLLGILERQNLAVTYVHALQYDANRRMKVQVRLDAQDTSPRKLEHLISAQDGVTHVTVDHFG